METSPEYSVCVLSRRLQSYCSDYCFTTRAIPCTNTLTNAPRLQDVNTHQLVKQQITQAYSHQSPPAYCYWARTNKNVQSHRENPRHMLCCRWFCSPTFLNNKTSGPFMWKHTSAASLAVQDAKGWAVSQDSQSPHTAMPLHRHVQRQQPCDHP